MHVNFVCKLWLLTQSSLMRKWKIMLAYRTQNLPNCHLHRHDLYQIESLSGYFISSCDKPICPYKLSKQGQFVNKELGMDVTSGKKG